MNVLIILAHPSPQSFSHKLAKTYQEGAAGAKHRVEVLDLYQTKLQLPFLQPESKAEYQKNQATRVKLQAKISEADEIVIIHPLWWGGPPAILKNLIDQIFTPGFAYKTPKYKLFVPERLKLRSVGLLKGRKVRLFITCDTQSWTNVLKLAPYLNMWYFYVIRQSGMKLKSFQLFDFMKNRDELQRSKWLAKVHRMGMRTR